MKKLWGWLVGLFGVLAGAFLFENYRRRKAEANLANAEHEAQDQLLDYQQGQKDQQIADKQKEMNTLKEEHDQAIKEAQKDLTPEQVEDYWKRRNNPK